MCGGTSSAALLPVFVQVYPRVCGGTATTAERPAFVPGLSPRVRGNPVYRDLERKSVRSIPACAGEPLVKRQPSIVGTVYPRVCGGTYIARRFDFLIQGLSPRVRGNLVSFRPTAQSVRSIPACAGEPDLASDSDITEKVYPRVCGGTFRAGKPTR